MIDANRRHPFVEGRLRALALTEEDWCTPDLQALLRGAADAIAALRIGKAAANIMAARKIERRYGSDIPAEAHRDFLADAIRRCLRTLDQLDLATYFDEVEKQNPLALAILAMHDELRPALSIFEAGLSTVASEPAAARTEP